MRDIDFSSNLQRGYISTSALPQYIPSESKSKDAPGINISVESAADKKGEKILSERDTPIGEIGYQEEDAVAMLRPEDSQKTQHKNSGINPVENNNGFHALSASGGGLDFAAAMKVKEQKKLLDDYLQAPSGKSLKDMKKFMYQHLTFQKWMLIRI